MTFEFYIETCEIALQMEQNGASKADHYRSGFLECITETMDYISHHLPASNSNNVNEEFCSKLFAHLHNYCDKTTSRLGMLKQFLFKKGEKKL